MTPALFAAVFLSGIVMGYLYVHSEQRPLRVVKLIKKTVGPTEEEQTEEFIARMHDATKDDRRLRNASTKKKRNQAPLALTATPSSTDVEMRRMKAWLDEHGGVRNRPKPGTATTLQRTVSTSRRTSTLK